MHNETTVTGEHSPNWTPPDNTAPQCISRCYGEDRSDALISFDITVYQLPTLKRFSKQLFKLKAMTSPARKKTILNLLNASDQGNLSLCVGTLINKSSLGVPAHVEFFV